MKDSTELSRPEKLKLIKIHRGFRGSGDQYKYGDKVYEIYRNHERFYAFDKAKHTAINDAVFYSDRFEDYRPFMKKFRIFLNENP